MSAARLVLAGRRERDMAHAWIEKAPENARLELKEPKRSLPQNDLFWTLMQEVSQRHRHNGLKLGKEDWRTLFMQAWGAEMRMVPSLAGDSLVPLNRSSTDLSRAEMSDLIEWIFAWAAETGFVFTEPTRSTNPGGLKEPSGSGVLEGVG